MGKCAVSDTQCFSYIHTALFTGGRYGDGEMAGETVRHVVHREMWDPVG